MEGASLDRKTGKLVESRPKVLYEQMPVIYIYAINTTAGKDSKLYECPIYRKPARTDLNYIGSIDFESDIGPRHWTMRGVALLCDIKYQAKALYRMADKMDRYVTKASQHFDASNKTIALARGRLMAELQRTGTAPKLESQTTDKTIITRCVFQRPFHCFRTSFHLLFPSLSPSSF